jgi:hypothetical protein
MQIYEDGTEVYLHTKSLHKLSFLCENLHILCHKKDVIIGSQCLLERDFGSLQMLIRVYDSVCLLYYDRTRDVKIAGFPQTQVLKRLMGLSSFHSC